MVLGKIPVPGHPTIWITVGQGHTELAVGAGGGCLDIFTLIQCSHSRRIVRDSRRNFNNRACFKYHTRAFTHVFRTEKKIFSSDHIARIVILISFFIASSFLCSFILENSV